MKIEQISIDKLTPYERNPRKNDHAVEQIAKAINQFGFRVPILAKSDGLIIDGHLRLKAAKFLGLETVPVIYLDDLTPAQIKAFRLNINKMAELAEWDNELLQSELSELVDLGFDISVTGFENIEPFEPNFLPGTEEDQGKLDQKESWTVTVVLNNEDDQQSLFVELRDRGFKVKV